MLPPLAQYGAVFIADLEGMWVAALQSIVIQYWPAIRQR